MNICLSCGRELKGRNTKYCSNTCQGNLRHKYTCERIERTNEYTGKSLKTLRNYLIDKNGHKCSICGETKWLNNPIPLLVDHIDGHPENKQLTNYRIICPNCDALLPTFKGRNKGNGRKDRALKYHSH